MDIRKELSIACCECLNCTGGKVGGGSLAREGGFQNPPLATPLFSAIKRVVCCTENRPIRCRMIYLSSIKVLNI